MAMHWDVTEIIVQDDTTLWVRFHDGLEGVVEFWSCKFSCDRNHGAGTVQQASLIRIKGLDEANPLALCCQPAPSQENLQEGKIYRRKFIKSQILSCAKNAVNQSSINQQDVKGLRINLPPLDFQQTFATRIQAVEALKTQHCATLTELNSLFASLQHRAFCGEL